MLINDVSYEDLASASSTLIRLNMKTGALVVLKATYEKAPNQHERLKILESVKSIFDQMDQKDRQKLDQEVIDFINEKYPTPKKII